MHFDLHGAVVRLSVATALESMGWNTGMVAASKNEAFSPSLPKPPQTSFVRILRSRLLYLEGLSVPLVPSPGSDSLPL